MKRFLLACLCLLFFAFSAGAQELWSLPSAERLVPDDSCRLCFPGGTQRFYGMFRSWDTLLQEGIGNVNILHIGGSHVQAGTFSHQMRCRLYGMAPGLEGRRGLIFPFTAAKTNNPSNYRVVCSGNWNCCKNTQREPAYPMGLSGMVVVPQSAAARLEVHLRDNVSGAFDFNRVRLFGYSDSLRVEPLLRIADTLYRGVYDSLSRSYLFQLERYSDSVTFLFRPTDSVWEPFYLRGILLDNDLPGFSYHAVGVNGASLPSYLQCPMFENDLAFVRPDLCIFGIGINDASGDKFDTVLFRQRYERLMEEILNVSPQCRFLFITNNDSYRKTGRRRYAVNANGQLAQEVFYRLAEKYEVAVFDQFALMGGLGSMKKWEAAGLAQSDKVHFTAKGYRYLGDLLYNALMYSYMDYLKMEGQADGK